jgi:hypothetical protein
LENEKGDYSLAGGEAFQMISLHSLPFIADCYAKGIRGYDAANALDAMVTSANKDTCGFSGDALLEFKMTNFPVMK